MTIEILETTITQDEGGIDASRSVTISITDGATTYLWYVGSLPLVGDLQPVLDAREAKLFAAASAKGRTFDVFDVKERRVLKALALVMLDEINAHAAKINEILDAIDTATNLAEVKSLIATISDYPQRDESQIYGAIKAKLMG